MTEPSFILGGDVDQVAVRLRVFADDLEPEWVTGLLGVAPTDAGRKGERNPDDPEIRYRVGFWVLELPDTREWILPDAIRTLLSLLPAEPAVWEELSGRAKLDLMCGLFLHQMNRGVELSAGLLGELARRRLQLSLDIYCIHGTG